MTAREDKIGPKKEAAILALLTARGIEDAAKTANVPARTLYRWLKEPAFDAAYRRGREKSLNDPPNLLVRRFRDQIHVSPTGAI